MATDIEAPTQRLVVEISRDRMEAWIRLANRADREPLTQDEIQATLKEAGVGAVDSVPQHIDEFIAAMESTEERPEKSVIARGRPPTEGIDGEFEWDPRFEEQSALWQGDAPINYYSMSAIAIVNEGEPIGKIIPPVPPKDGLDVTEKVVKLSKQPTEVQCDDTVRVAEDGSGAVFANVAGKVVYAQLRLSIDEVITVRGDVDFEIGNIETPTDVYITGNIPDRFEVKSEKSVTVGGAIEAAIVHADRNINVRGGVLGRGKGKVTAEGEIVVKFCDDVTLEAKGDIKVTREVMNSRIQTESSLLVGSGSIIGGTIYARKAIEARTLGSDAGVQLPITLGIHPDVLREARRIQESLKPKQEVVDRIRQMLQPLLADRKRLSAEQKERATELLFKADETELEIHDAQEARKKMLEEAEGENPPYLLVTNEIHAGTSVRIGGRHTVFTKEVKGPIKVERRKVKNVTEFVTVNQLTGSMAILPSSEFVDEDPPEEADEGDKTER